MTEQDWVAVECVVTILGVAVAVAVTAWWLVTP